MNLRKYWFLLKSNIALGMEYRGEFFGWLLVDTFSLLSAIFLWFAIFRTNDVVGGYDFNGIMTYYLLVPFIGSLTSVFVSGYLPHIIKDGDISKDLVKPYNITLVSFISQFSFKITQLPINIALYFSVGYFLSTIFNIQFHLEFILLALLVCLFSFILHFFLDFLLSMSAFYFDEVWFLAHFKNILLLVFGGLSFPLDILPIGLQNFFGILPFRFMYYFPVKIAQGDFTNSYMMSEFLQMILWIIVFYLLGKLLWKFGIKKYGAYGN